MAGAAARRRLRFWAPGIALMLLSAGTLAALGLLSLGAIPDGPERTRTALAFGAGGALLLLALLGAWILLDAVLIRPLGALARGASIMAHSNPGHELEIPRRHLLGELPESLQSLGASPIQSFFQVTLPLLLPAVFAGFLFAFTISFDDITGTLFWKPGGVETVPTQIFAMLRNSISPEINALGTVMILVTVALPLLGAAIARRLGARSST